MRINFFGVLSSLVFVAILTFAALLFRLIAPIHYGRFARACTSQTCLFGMSIVALTAFLVLLAVNTVYPGYFDHGEGNIAAVSWLALKGVPIYHGLASPDRYSLFYGPFFYLPFSVAMWVFGPTIVALKLVLLTANLLFVYILWRSYRHLSDTRTALILVALVVAFSFLMRPTNILLQVRADVLLLTFVALGIYALRQSGPISSVLLSATAAFAMDVKFTAFIYFIPLLVRHSRQRGRREAFVVAVGSMSMSLLPFLLPNVSLRLYLQWIRQGSHHPLSFVEFNDAAKAVVILLAPLPLIVGVSPWRDAATIAYFREGRFPLIAFAISLAGMVAVSSKVGSGSHHLLPFLPLLGYEYGLLWTAVTSLRPSVMLRYLRSCFALMVAVRIAGGLTPTLSIWGSGWRWARAVETDISSIQKRHLGERIEMGYGDGSFLASYGGEPDPATFFRLMLVAKTNHLTVDASAMGDMQISGVPIPSSTIDEIAACSTKIWLIPKGELPFSTENIYSRMYPRQFPSLQLFGPEFREAFARTYRQEESSQFFDLWECRRPSASNG
jgi:hypothetical protein